MRKILIPSMLLAMSLLISCGSEDSKLSLGKFNPGGGQSDGLDKADAKTKDPAEINALIKRLSDAVNSIKKPEQLSNVMLKAVASEFSGLSPRKIKARPNKDKNGKVEKEVELVVAVPASFDIETMNLNKIVSSSDKSNVTYTLDISFKGSDKIKLVEVDGGDTFIILEAKSEKETVRALYTESLGQAHDVRLLVVKRYIDGKVKSVNPFVELNIAGKNKVDQSQLGAFSGLKAFVEPISRKAFVKASYDKFSLKSKVLDGVMLPSSLEFLTPDAVQISLAFIKEEDIQGIRISADGKPVSFTFIESFLGLL